MPQSLSTSLGIMTIELFVKKIVDNFNPCNEICESLIFGDNYSEGLVIIARVIMIRY